MQSIKLPTVRSRTRRATIAPPWWARDRGSAVAEFVFVAMLAVFLLFGVLQVAVYFYVRNVVSASAAAGARAAANADVEPALGAALAQDRIRTSLGSAAAKEVRCTAENTTDDPSGLLVVSVRCVGRIHTSFFPAGEFLELDVRSRALKEGR